MSNSTFPTGPVAQSMAAKLQTALEPSRLEIEDQSHLHAGHAHAKDLRAGETHFAVLVVAEGFRGQSRVQRQRQIYKILADELAAGVHALALTALTPEENT